MGFWKKRGLGRRYTGRGGEDREEPGEIPGGKKPRDIFRVGRENAPRGAEARVGRAALIEIPTPPVQLPPYNPLPLTLLLP